MYRAEVSTTSDTRMHRTVIVMRQNRSRTPSHFMFRRASLAPRHTACKLGAGRSGQVVRIQHAVWTPVLYCPSQDLQVPVASSPVTRPPVARAVVLPRPHQYLQMPIRSGNVRRAFIPRAPVLPRPLQHLQVPAPSGACKRPLVPRISVLPRPTQHLQVPARSGIERKLVPRTPVL
jgi:hypothetical protein